MHITKQKVIIPTYSLGVPEELPIFFEKRPYQGASGKVYPIPYTAALSDHKEDKEYDAVVLENEYVKTVILPALGGKIHSAFDKTTGYDFIYNNKVIKPAMVGLAGPWVAGGIEFNWPQHHRPTTFMPVPTVVREEDGKTAVYVGENDYFLHMKSCCKLSLDSEGSCIRADITVYNSTPTAQPFMWWANMAVEVNDDYKIVFPPDVEYVNDHDRRAVLNWPIARGVYHTARPFDYGTGTDIHNNPAVRVPSSFMVSKGQSDMDFVAGYDAGKQCGVVTVADHRVAPGKKLWTWGDGAFGHKWCSNLTDDGSRYVELMTGCYTDNQPDFTWIAPYETKKFTQYWFPVRDIGEPKNATVDGACNLEDREEGLFVGFYSTQVRKNVKVSLSENGKTVAEYTASVAPDKTFTATVRGMHTQGVTLCVQDENGRELIRYTPPTRGHKKPIAPRLPAAKPADITTVEELYLNGIHLKQYKHFAFEAQDYFLEGLRRDPGDIRNNIAMGDLCLERGMYASAVRYYDAAITRLTCRNPNPYDTDPYYKRALCKFATGDSAGAYDDAYIAVWSYPQRAAGYYLLAKIEASRGNVDGASDFLRQSLQTQSENPMGEYVLFVLEGDPDADARIVEKYPLFFGDMTLEKDAVDIALELMQFGLLERAQSMLCKASDGAMKFYYLAYIAGRLGDRESQREYVRKADACNWRREFPSRRESLAVLQDAGTPMAEYYRGCILYHFMRYDDACAAFENCLAKKDFAPAHRNLALGLFDHLNRKDEARSHLEQAFASMPYSDRLFYELTQLYKALDISVSERLEFYAKHADLVQKRDDCTLALSVLYTVTGDYENAERVLKNHRFHTYEGGEGNLTQHHAWLKFLQGRKALEAHDFGSAKRLFEDGLTFPENYGEEKNYFVNDAPIYSQLATVCEQTGDKSTFEKYLTLADSTKGVPTVHSYFQCLALRRAGKTEKAEALAKEMIAMGEKKIENASVDDYYGVGAPAYPPFGYDITAAHTAQGNALRAFGYLALGNRADADRAIDAVHRYDKGDFFAYLYRAVTQ